MSSYPRHWGLSTKQLLENEWTNFAHAAARHRSDGAGASIRLVAAARPVRVMDGTPRRTAAPARCARRLRRHTLTGWQGCRASPSTPRWVVAARLARQRTPRTAAVP